ncbi:electron transporter [Metapseudomonas resinovorans]|uniref:SCO family protein n=1 Tax=Metapseudomonas resinovorans TaxID=53412 RepID=UPI000986C1FD|nr:SCO family protein [Pseudomonas resinovorans]GLZ88013.1 electron transporter [Pseudomonas resinovorans]
MYRWLSCVLASLLITGCGEQSWQTQDVTGKMPRLEFNLTDENGQAVSEKDYLGKIVLLFFGFTRCPDVCPTTLAKISAASKKLDEQTQRDLQVLFVSVDPSRDNQQLLRTYTDAFGPQFIGLTGDKSSLDNLTRRYHSIYEYGAKDQSGNYDVSHSIAVYAFNRDGEVRVLFRDSDPLDAVVADLRQLSEGS